MYLNQSISSVALTKLSSVNSVDPHTIIEDVLDGFSMYVRNYGRKKCCKCRAKGEEKEINRILYNQGVALKWFLNTNNSSQVVFGHIGAYNLKHSLSFLNFFPRIENQT